MVSIALALQSIPRTLNVSQEYILDGMPYHRTTHTHTQTFIYTFREFGVANPPTSMFLKGERKTENLEEPTQTVENMQNLTQNSCANVEL